MGLSVLALWLTGCTSFRTKHAEVYHHLSYGNPQLALQALEQTRHGRRNRILYKLDKAMLLRLTGDFEGSNTLFENAKTSMQRLEAMSISENLASVTINETLRSYVGQPYEQMMLYAYKTLNYLDLNDIQSARIEVLQADAKIRGWLASKQWQGIDASVFMRYLSGIVFELNGEPGEALIAYRKAFGVLEKHDIQVPLYLQKDLLRLTRHLDLKDEYQRYRKQFPATASPDIKLRQQQGEVILIFHQGLVPYLNQKIITNFHPDIKQHYRIAVPFYPSQTPIIEHLQFRIADQVQDTVILQNNDQLARDNLKARIPGIIARAALRAVAKKAAAKKTEENNEVASLIVDLAGLLTEHADTRSWTSLPATIQIARVNVPAGECRVQMTAPMINKAHGSGYERVISLAAKQKAVISVHGTINKVFSEEE